jgi:MinD-like ATPase involved in chromosome partitioning or flagellar assembly
VLVACWSVKGGSGTTVVAACLALLLARSSPTGALLVDLGGDAPAALGIGEPTGPGVADWLEADAAADANGDPDADALDRLAVDAGDGVRLVPWRSADAPAPGAPLLRGTDGERLAAALAGRGPVVVDCGTPGSQPGAAVAAAATVSLLVVRPCYLALRRAVHAPVRPSRLVIVEEHGRVLRPLDLATALDVPIGARVPWDPAIARSVDAGLLLHGLPRMLERALEEAA